MSLLNTTVTAKLEEGAYSAIILDYKETPEDWKFRPYIEVRLQVKDQVIIDRWYESRIRYIMSCLTSQFGLEYETVSLKDVLDVATTKEFCITIEYSSKYGRQISYSEPS